MVAVESGTDPLTRNLTSPSSITNDIAKAFDRVYHTALLNILPSHGLFSKLCQWASNLLHYNEKRDNLLILNSRCCVIGSVFHSLEDLGTKYWSIYSWDVRVSRSG